MISHILNITDLFLCPFCNKLCQTQNIYYHNTNENKIMTISIFTIEKRGSQLLICEPKDERWGDDIDLPIKQWFVNNFKVLNFETGEWFEITNITLSNCECINNKIFVFDKYNLKYIIFDTDDNYPHYIYGNSKDSKCIYLLKNFILYECQLDWILFPFSIINGFKKIKLKQIKIFHNKNYNLIDNFVKDQKQFNNIFK